MSTLDQFVDAHLDLQVKISYNEHHGFLLRHGLLTCKNILDVGTGNGTFIAKIAIDHPEIQFVGIDKRQHLVEACKKKRIQNLKAIQTDLFSSSTSFDYSAYDGVLMRYFLLHVDHSHKIFKLFQEKLKRPSRIWIIDLDCSKISCDPTHPTFEKFLKLIKDFCINISVDSRGGESVLPLLKKYNFQEIIFENIPFSSVNISLKDLALYLRQEVLCYSKMLGRNELDLDIKEILNFIDHEVLSGKVKLCYGMILVSALLTDE